MIMHTETLFEFIKNPHFDSLIPHADPYPIRNTQRKEGRDRNVPNERCIRVYDPHMNKEHHDEYQYHAKKPHMCHERDHTGVAIKHSSPFPIEIRKVSGIRIIPAG